MSRSPIPRVLSTIQRHRVEALLMGGQACVLYGAAEFSRDADFAILASADNMDRLEAAMDELEAEVIAVPPFEARYLERGHAVHFRCHHPDARGFRVDVMSRMRGVDGFPTLWDRRTTWTLPGALEIDSLSLPDLVASKKTQRDKDWPMVRRLVEASYASSHHSPTEEQVEFWLRELRTPEVLIEVASRFREEANRIGGARPAVELALGGDEEAVRQALAVEQEAEREKDRRYWAPLREELERLRRRKRSREDEP